MDIDRIPAAVIRSQLAKILRSVAFANRRSTGRLLRFFVEETLRDGQNPISQRQIATYGLGLDEEFSPSRSAHVRVVVRRLRGALEDYYTSASRDDPVIFRLTPGPYRLIAKLAPGQRAAESQGPSAIVEPRARRSLPTLLLMEPAVEGEAVGDGELAREVAALVASALVSSPFVTAVGPLLRASLAAEHGPPQVAATLGFDYVLDASIRRLDDGRVRVAVDVSGTDGGGSILVQQVEIGSDADGRNLTDGRTPATGRTMAHEIAAWLCHRIGDASLRTHAESGRGPRACGITEEDLTMP